MMAALSALPVHLLITGGSIAVLLCAFLALFLAPGLLHWLRLARLETRLAKLGDRPGDDELTRLFAGDKPLARLWGDYRDALHTPPGAPRPRASAPAEAWFNVASVVDSRLRTDFFKHLPGLFTGIGIIGTFTGLIEGLHRFQVSDDTLAVRSSLESLMHAVGQAFLVSAAAITAAMAVTFAEKLLLAALYRRTERLAHAIDALHDGGAGDEYLARLVTASEASATQSQALKTALVQEIGALLRELSAAQIEASRQESQRLGQSLADALKAPLQAIAAGLKTAGAGSGGDATQRLEQVLGAFGQRLEGALAAPAASLGQAQQQAAQSMQEAVKALQSVGTGLADAQRRAGDAAAERIDGALREMDHRQERLQQQMEALIEQMRHAAVSAQSESSQSLQAALAQLGQQIGEMVAALGSRLGAVQQQALAGQQQREQALAQQTAEAVGAMSGSVEQAVKHMGLASVQMAKSVQALTQTTTQSLDKLHAAAELVSGGAQGFATAGERVSGVLDRAAGLAGQLRDTAGALTDGASAFRAGLDDYRAQREAVGHLLGELRATVELARKEASLTGDVLRRIESSAERLGQAQHQSDQYLSGVTRVLAEAHQAFAEATRKTLDRANTEFHAKLATSVGLLSSTIVELEASLGSAMPRH